MTTDSCFKCSNENSILCPLCGIAKDGAREHFKQKPVTNYDRIISKTPEELARRIAARTACMDCILLEECKRRTERRRCVDMWLDWLKSPVEVDE